MKRPNLFLTVSLVVNAALLAALALTPGMRDTGGAASSSAESEIARPQAARTSDDAGATVRRSVANALSSPTRNLWGRLYSDDLDQLAARLRAAGFPNLAVRMVVLDVVQQKREAAQASIMGPREDVPYWKVMSSMPDDPEQRALLAVAMSEYSQVIRKNFYSADALAEEEGMAAVARRRFGDLPLEKLQQLWKIEGDYAELRQEIFQSLSAGGARELSAADRERLALLDAEKRRDLQQALTPDEFEQFELRSSPTAESLRTKLEVFRPTEAEFKALFALHRSIDEQFDLFVADEQTRRAHAAATAALKPQIEAALGAERYADYVQAMERGSDKLNRLIARLDLPLSTAGKVDVVQREITQRGDAIRDDQNLSGIEREARLVALAQEAQTRLTSTLGGTRGYVAYEDMRGDWIRALRPKAPER